MGRLRDKVVLITGGTAGIGRGCAQRAISEGATVLVTGRDVERGQTCVSLLEGRVDYVQHDACVEESWQQLVEYVRAKHGRMDVLVNNVGSAGSGAVQDPEHVSLSEWRFVLQQNLDTVFLGCRAAIACMARCGSGGSIINMSSTAGLVATPAISAYGAAKAAVRHLTKSIALYCARQGNGIRCNSVHPALVETDLGRSILALYGDEPEPTMRAYLQRVPMGRMGKIEDVADAVLYLASDESSYVTGAELVIGGGLGI